MIFNPNIHHRKSIRLQNFDYSQTEYYFITMCTKNRECLFGDVVDGKMVLHAYGQITHDECLRTGQIRQNVRMDAHIIMPNHVHGAVGIAEAYGHTPRPHPNPSTILISSSVNPYNAYTNLSIS